MQVGDSEVAVFGGLVLHARIVAQLFCVLFHVMSFFMSDEAFGFAGLVHVLCKIDRAVLVNFPSRRWNPEQATRRS